MNFLKTFFASCLGAIVALLVVILIGFVLLIGATAEEEVVISKNSILHLRLDAPIVEHRGDKEVSGLPFGAPIATIGLVQLKDAIKHAKKDENIEGIFLEVSMPQAGFATIEEVRTALSDFKESGKWIVAYSEMYSEKAFYLASVADKVLLFKEGDFEFNGLTIEGEFYKKLLDKLEIKPQVFRVGEFKSAVEPFLLEKMSAENRLQITSLVNSIYDEVLTKLADARKIDKAKLKEISDKMLVKNGDEAKEQGLIDGLVYYDEVLDEFRSRLGSDSSSKKKVNLVRYSRYRKSFSSYVSSKNEIAVIVADGEIMPGKADDGLVGSDTFAEAIRKARENDNVKAIVIRVNSPGGSFTASDVMWREIDLATKTKPVIASMSDVAASGGYYLAMACDTIVAQPNTITGSIGIFGVMFDLSSFLENKIGITFDEVKTGQYGERFTVTRPLTEAEKRIWQSELERHYETFTLKAAQGRNVSQEAIKAVGGGRVWTGAQAKENHLVDVLGNFDDAVKIAATSAGVENDYKLSFYPKKKPFIEEFLETLNGDIQARSMKAELGEYYIWFKKWEELKTKQGAQARLPFDFQIN